jgi:ketosteroid isomerase-like protein
MSPVSSAWSLVRCLGRRDTRPAMAEEDVEVARRAFDSFNRRELATAVEAFGPDAEWIPYLAALEEDTYRGRDQIEAMWRDVLGDFPDFRIELVDVVADRGDTLVFEVEFQGMGRASGADTRTTVFQVTSFRDGKVARVEGFRERRGALAAVGLRE